MKTTKAIMPTIICLCGSTKFKNTFARIIEKETLKNKIVLSVGCFSHANEIKLIKEQKEMLTALHKIKIDMAHEILFLNVNKYMGDGAVEEYNYAYNHPDNKKIILLEEPDQIGDNRLIQVCSECLQASCWQGNFMCDESKEAYTIYQTVRQLKIENREHPDYWKTDEQLSEDINENSQCQSKRKKTTTMGRI